MKQLLRWLPIFLLVVAFSATAQNNNYILKIDPSGTSSGVLIVKPGDVIQFTAKAYELSAAGTMVEIPISSISWSVSPASFGTITPQGLFTAAAQNSASTRGTVTAVASTGHITIHGSVALAFHPNPATHYTFTGNVHSASGPIANAQVSVMGAANLPFLITGLTDAHGNYSIQAPAGTYIIRASAAGFVAEFFDNVPTQAQATRFITDPNVPTYDHIDFLLDATPHHSGSIAGTVTDGNGNPIADVVVAAWINGHPATNASLAIYGKAVTAANGSYVIDQLPPGDYIVRAAAHGFIPEYYDNASAISQAAAVTVATQPVTGIDFSLDHGGSISGTVYGENVNAPLAHATVIVRSHTQNFERGTRCDGHGRYTVDGLPTGVYTIFASAYRFIGEYYDNAATATQAALLTLNAPAAVTDIDFMLAPAPVTPHRYNGSVIARTGGAPAHVIVEAINPATGMLVATSTDGNGNFDFGAWDGAVIRARALGYVGMYAGNTRNWKESQWSGASAGMTFTLDPVAEQGMATFSGIVKDAASGEALPNAWVYGYDAAGLVYFSVTGRDGAFNIANTPNGSLDMMVSEVGYENETAAGVISEASGSGTLNAHRSGVTSADRTQALPSAPILYQNYPNPFNPATTITFALPERMFVSVRVYDLLGRQVATVTEGTLNAGMHRVGFDASKLPSGIYLYRMESGGQTFTRRMTLTK